MHQSFLDRFNVKNRITLGFSAALGVAILGAAMGIVVGNYFQNKAIKIDDHITENVEILSKLKIDILRARTHQQQLIPLSEFPEDFKEEYAHILQRSAWIQESLQKIGTSLLDEHYYLNKDHTAEYKEFLKTYQDIPKAYLEELDRLVESIDVDNISSSEELVQAQQKLLEFTNSDLAINYDSILDELSGLIQEVNEDLNQAHNNVETAGRSRILIISVSMLLSSSLGALLAYTISESINVPLQAMAETARQITQNGNFNLRVDVLRDDEVGTVATALNLMIQRVNDLVAEQRTRATELEESNQRLVSTQKQMIAQEKLASLGSLTAGIAHEIKNPLNFVNNFSELSIELIDELAETLKAQETKLDSNSVENIVDIVDTLRINISKIEHHGKRADKIVANMLMHSRGEGSIWVDVDINDLVREAVNLAYNGMRVKLSNFNLEFDNDYDSSISPICVCPQDLNRVFLNLASNACYAVHQRQLEEESSFIPILKVRTRNQENQVEIRIRDNGIGMTSEVQDKIFNQFFSTKPTGDGTGLGLSLSYSIVVEQHNGTLDVVSEPGLYAEFIVTLPKQANPNKLLTPTT